MREVITFCNLKVQGFKTQPCAIWLVSLNLANIDLAIKYALKTKMYYICTKFRT